jgi:hypothetical protein
VFDAAVEAVGEFATRLAEAVPVCAQSPRLPDECFRDLAAVGSDDAYGDDAIALNAPRRRMQGPEEGRSGFIVVPRQTSASVAELATSGARVCSAAGPAFVLARASRRDGRVAHRRRVVDPQTQVRDERSATDRDGLDPQRRRHGLVSCRSAPCEERA